MEKIKKKFDYAVQLIQSQISQDCQIKPENIQEMHDYISNNIVEFKYYSQLRYVKHDSERLYLQVVHSKSFRSEYLLIVQELKKERKKSSCLNKLKSFFDKNQSNNIFNALLMDPQFPLASSHLVLHRKYLVKFYDLNKVNNEKQFIFTVNDVKKLNYPYVKILKISPKDLSQSATKNYSKIIKGCINLEELTIKVINHRKQKIQTKDFLSLWPHSRSLQKLSIHLNFFDEQYEQELFMKLSQKIAELNNLTSFEFKNTISAGRLMLRALQKQNSESIKELNLQFNSLQINNDEEEEEEEEERFIGDLKSFINLTNFSCKLELKSMNEKLSEEIRKSLCSISHITQCYLYCGGQQLEQKQFDIITNGFHNFFNLIKFTLCISYPTIPFKGILKFFQQISNNKMLRELTFYQSQVFNDNMKKLWRCKNLWQHFINLQVFCHNDIFYKPNIDLINIRKRALRLVKIVMERKILN